MSKQGAIRIGTCGWIYKHWRGIFYPERLPVTRWLSFYSQHFDTVEINNTFYRLPEARVFADWRRRAPPEFLYALKANRFLTHMKKLKDPADALQRILDRVRVLGPHLGPVLYQLPPSWACDVERLRQFISLLPSDMDHVFEFRHDSWYTDDVRRLLTQTRMSFCVHDMRGACCPNWATGPIVYLRFHGPTDPRCGGRYTLAHLRRCAEEIRHFQENRHDVYVYFNNDGGGYAVRNARELKELLGLKPEACIRDGRWTVESGG
jgi:uncharacterized protein YecE (DUF72 family)